jgi:subtilisin family serine protease
VNIIQVAAAGNANDEAKDHVPAGFAGVISVASMTDGYELGSSSSYGTDIAIIAPGVGVTFAAANSNNGYITITGISFAAPLVAGVCAQSLSKLGPGKPRNELYQMLINFSIKDKVTLTAGKENTPDRVINNGFLT